MANTPFYLGRAYDPNEKTTTTESVFYDPADLTTHAVVTGMTGSGKTGLCIALLEEAALAGIPAIIIDLKGDLTNLLLHFPDLAPQDFQPWIDPEMARRAGKTLDQLSTDASDSWRDGLQEWGIGQDQILALKNAAQYAIYTPGSDAGIPVSVLSSLAAPALAWKDHREPLREKISSTVTALLGLVGYEDIDPIRSREHILLSKLFEDAWSQGKDVDLSELILLTQDPSSKFDKLGALPVETFFPAKDRMELAMSLNNILAAPAFEVWREGQSLDIRSMLFAEDNRPRHNIFYMAHLSDDERMFFITLLLSAVESWMRTQSGATSLRALLYMDEIFGYLPPQRNPPSKQPLLRMLKQARAFGLGLLLATQNPVDVDYKALSNAGTWFIGKLQTEQDKNRLLDGLESASGGVPRSVFDKLISSLGKRVFVLHNVHAKEPQLFQTRWAMNFLAGPLTRAQIPALNRLAGAKITEPVIDPGETVPSRPLAVTTPTAVIQDPAIDSGETVMASAPLLRAALPRTPADGTLAKPPIPAWIKEYFLPQNYSLPEAFSAARQTMPAEVMSEGVIYRATLLASAHVRILDRKLGVDSEIVRTVLVNKPEKRGSVRWEESLYAGPTLDGLDTAPMPSARFGTIDSPLNDTKLMTALQKDFTDWAYRSTSVKARANQALKVYAGPDVSQADFMRACAEAAREARDAEILKKTAVIDRQIKTLEDRIMREERELREDETELSHRKMEETSSHIENVTGIFRKGRMRRLSSSLSKRRLAEQAKADVEESRDVIEDNRKKIAELERHREEVIAEISDKWGEIVSNTSEVTVVPKKSDVFVELFGVAWMPYYIIRTDVQSMELPAFGAQ